MSANHIVLISSGQPALNPRLVKEADALVEAGYIVTVLYAYWNDWGTEFDKQLLSAKKWRPVRVGGHPQSSGLKYNLSRAIFKAAKAINTGTFADWAQARSTFFLVFEAKKHKASLYIAHNLGALPAAVIAAEKNKALCGFDAEDFHRFEVTDDSSSKDYKSKSSIENKYIPKLDYFTASSPLIADAYKKLYPTLSPGVLLNVFPNQDVTNETVERTGPVKLFWFSQTIGTGRGLEDIATALKRLNKEAFELHLLGNLQPDYTFFVNDMIISGISVKIHEPIHPDNIIDFARQFDIGLALENKSPLNRDLCLTNKIFTYLQAGLAIIASDTAAQAAFMLKNPQVGQLYPNKNIDNLADILLAFESDKNRLADYKRCALKLAQQRYNWEAESLKLLALVKKTLNAGK